LILPLHDQHMNTCNEELDVAIQQQKKWKEHKKTKQQYKTK
jgi:hypothetical protein